MILVMTIIGDVTMHWLKPAVMNFDVFSNMALVMTNSVGINSAGIVPFSILFGIWTSFYPFYNNYGLKYQVGIIPKK